MTCNRGNISSSGKQPSGPVPFISAPVNRPARQVAVQSVFTEAVEWGRGVRGRGGKDSHSIALTGWLSRRPWPRRRYGEPEKIRLSCCDFGANSCKAQLILFVHSDLWNHQVSSKVSHLTVVPCAMVQQLYPFSQERNSYSWAQMEKK